ncbi:hypothetical protein J3454_15545 [Erythrobacter sp. NFXS35]|uniref:hypothetical protein n=1 Tax=Erythrobacter sp. NFXS35 TaxID=2818436 RepID=UPI0032DF2770
MKKILLAVATAPLAFMAVGAHAAETSSEDLEISATVLPECSLADLNPVNFGTLAINTAAGPDALLLTGTRQDSGQQVWTSCNYAATISIEGQPMENQDQQNTGPDAGDFTDELNYRITWRSDNGNDFLQANLRTAQSSVVSRVQNGAFHNNAIVNTALATEDNPLRPLSGTYTAVATLTLGAI